MKIYDDAHKLAKQIRESKEYKEYKELKENPHDRKKLMEIIDSFGPMQSLFMEITTEKLADIIEEAI